MCERSEKFERSENERTFRSGGGTAIWNERGKQLGPTERSPSKLSCRDEDLGAGRPEQNDQANESSATGGGTRRGQLGKTSFAWP